MNTPKILIVLGIALFIAAPAVTAKIAPPSGGGTLPSSSGKLLGGHSGKPMGSIGLDASGKATMQANDPSCTTYMSAGFDVRGGHSLTVPHKVNGVRVTAWRVQTELTGLSSCVGLTKGGVLVHRGLPGSWTTTGDLEPGTYYLKVASPGSYTVRLNIDLVGGGQHANPIPLRAAA